MKATRNPQKSHVTSKQEYIDSVLHALATKLQVEVEPTVAKVFLKLLEQKTDVTDGIPQRLKKIEEDVTNLISEMESLAETLRKNGLYWSAA